MKKARINCTFLTTTTPNKTGTTTGSSIEILEKVLSIIVDSLSQITGREPSNVNINGNAVVLEHAREEDGVLAMMDAKEHHSHTSLQALHQIADHLRLNYIFKLEHYFMIYYYYQIML